MTHPASSPVHVIRCALRCGLLAAVGGIGLGALSVACTADRPAPPAATTGRETPRDLPSNSNETAPPPPDLAAHMQASFWEALRARDAIIEGDLPAAQRAADALADQRFSELVPADWSHWVNGMQQAARELSMAPNLSAASAELGRIALVCGECHDVHQRGPRRVRTEPEPWRDPPEALEARMLRHQTGAEQLWEGLVTPSENAFRSGTITLTRAPLTAPERESEPVDPALHARIEAVRTLARQARAATTYAERGRVYGELIARCADCHYHARPAP